MLFASCIPVKGFNRSIICDLQRNSYSYIPNDMFDIIFQYNGKSILDIKEKIDVEDFEVLDSYFKFLHENEFIFFTKKPEYFPKINLDWFEPFEINNAIIDVEIKHEFNFKEIFPQLEKLMCKSIEIRFFEIIDLKIIYDILSLLEKSKSILSSVGFVIPYSNDYSNELLEKIISLNPRIAYFIFYNSDRNEFVVPFGEKRSFILYSKESINSKLSCGTIGSKNFVVNTRLFTESQHHNTCLNRKISIDKDGNIKNCPSMPQSFGNIKDTTLEEALNHPDFKKYWNVNKDMIAVCKDCEFRHICTDCRAYTERTHFEEDIDLSKPLKCGYNPYTNEWAEWSTNPLKQKAIEFYGMQDLVKKDA